MYCSYLVVVGCISQTCPEQEGLKCLTLLKLVYVLEGEEYDLPSFLFKAYQKDLNLKFLLLITSQKKAQLSLKAKCVILTIYILSHAEVSYSPLSKPVFLHFRPVNLS